VIALPHGHPVDVGAPAPDFEIEGRSVPTKFRGKPVVLAFFQTDWDPARQHQLTLYNDVLSELDGNAHLVNLSYDHEWCEAEVTGEGALRFPLVTNLPANGDIAELYGVRGGEAVFVIDQEGIVRWRHVGPSHSLASMDQLVAVLRSLNRKGFSRQQFVFNAVATMVALTLVPAASHASAVSLL
jgi:peroxiredoxin